MNGRLFDGLNNLAEVSLNGNECISQNFLEQVQIATLARVVNEKCGFCQSGNQIEAQICERTYQIEGNAEQRVQELLEAQKRQIEMLETLVNRTVDENVKCQTELDRTVGSITRLEGQVESANAQISLFGQLDRSRNENFLERIEELRSDLEAKTREFDEAKRELKLKTAQMTAKDQEINDLKKVLHQTDSIVEGVIH